MKYSVKQVEALIKQFNLTLVEFSPAGEQTDISFMVKYGHKVWNIQLGQDGVLSVLDTHTLEYWLEIDFGEIVKLIHDDIEMEVAANLASQLVIKKLGGTGGMHTHNHKH